MKIFDWVLCDLPATCLDRNTVCFRESAWIVNQLRSKQ